MTAAARPCPALQGAADGRPEDGVVAAALGRRWPEAAVWGFGIHLLAGLPAIFGWLIVGSAALDLLMQRIGGGGPLQDWETLGAFMPFGVGALVVTYLLAVGACLLIARARRLALFTMLSAGWLGFVLPFSAWLLFTLGR